MISTGLLSFPKFWNRNKTGAGMVPYLHVRFSFLIREKSSHSCFDYIWKNLFNLPPILTDLSCLHFLEEKRSSARGWATATLEGAVVSPSESHFLGSCSKRTKPGWAGLTLLRYAIGRLCGPVTGSVKVVMPNSGNRRAFCKQEEMHVLGSDPGLLALPDSTPSRATSPEEVGSPSQGTASQGYLHIHHHG